MDNNLNDRMRKAAEYLTEHGWLKGEMGHPGGSACLTGAIRFCAPMTGDEHIIRGVLARRDRAESWNDRNGTREADVIGFLRTAEITDADLADTYGRQWVEIVALVRAIANLTPDQRRSFAAAAAAYADAYAAAADAAAYAAYAAAADAAAYAADAAAYAAAYADAYAAYAAAYAAAYWARRVARGLAVRHLIGKNGFTQAHYDTLTGPWRRTIGKLHADDAELS